VTGCVRDGTEASSRASLKAEPAAPRAIRQLGVRARRHLPHWLAAVAKISPVTVTADAARSFALYGTPASLRAAAAWTGGLLAVFIPLSVWRCRRIS
jgi:hypothetical protein